MVMVRIVRIWIRFKVSASVNRVRVRVRLTYLVSVTLIWLDLGWGRIIAPFMYNCPSWMENNAVHSMYFVQLSKFGIW